MKNSTQFSVRSFQYAMRSTLRAGKFVRLTAYCALLTVYCALSSCGDKPGEPVKNDSVRENPLMKNLSEKEQEELRKIIGNIPIPFEIMSKVSGSGLPYKKDMLNPDANVSKYNKAEGQAVNIGVYGADMAYMIAFERLGESGAYLKSVRILADAVVIPTVFDEVAMKNYQVNSSQDSVQQMMYTSYTRIDSTLQSNERFGLAALVVAGGWIESLYLTTEQLNGEAKTENTKLLYEMLDEQQKHTDDVISMLAMFPNDSLFIELHRDVTGFKKISSPAAEYTVEELAAVTAHVAAMRSKLVSIQ
jgi:hypothetical protein